MSEYFLLSCLSGEDVGTFDRATVIPFHLFPIAALKWLWSWFPDIRFHVDICRRDGLLECDGMSMTILHTILEHTLSNLSPCDSTAYARVID